MFENFSEKQHNVLDSGLTNGLFDLRNTDKNDIFFSKAYLYILLYLTVVSYKTLSHESCNGSNFLQKSFDTSDVYKGAAVRLLEDSTAQKKVEHNVACYTFTKFMMKGLTIVLQNASVKYRMVYLTKLIK